MLLTFGTEIRPDTSPLLLEPADLALFESLAPLLGDTPRRVKRFVNICQLLYAMTPPLTSGTGVDSERARVALLSAICDGSAGIAGQLLDGIEATRPQPGAPMTAPNREPVTLSDFVDGLESTCDHAGTGTPDRLARRAPRLGCGATRPIRRAPGHGPPPAVRQADGGVAHARCSALNDLATGKATTARPTAPMPEDGDPREAGPDRTQ